MKKLLFIILASLTSTLGFGQYDWGSNDGIHFINTEKPDYTRMTTNDAGEFVKQAEYYYIFDKNCFWVEVVSFSKAGEILNYTAKALMYDDIYKKISVDKMEIWENPKHKENATDFPTTVYPFEVPIRIDGSISNGYLFYRQIDNKYEENQAISMLDLYFNTAEEGNAFIEKLTNNVNKIASAPDYVSDRTSGMFKNFETGIWRVVPKDNQADVATFTSYNGEVAYTVVKNKIYSGKKEKLLFDAVYNFTGSQDVTRNGNFSDCSSCKLYRYDSQGKEQFTLYRDGGYKIFSECAFVANDNRYKLIEGDNETQVYWHKKGGNYTSWFELSPDDPKTILGKNGTGVAYNVDGDLTIGNIMMILSIVKMMGLE